MKRRLLLTLAGLAPALAVRGARAQAWPAKPIRLVVPWPAGGLVDVAARQLATRLQAALGLSVVVDNRVGAGGAIGADQVAKAAADGHTLLFTSSGLTMGTALNAKLPFDVLKDFEPLALVAHAPSVLVVGPAINPGSVRELLELARAKPGRLSYASAGNGSPAHMVAELFKTRHQLFVVHIPYTGAPAAMNDQIGGRVDYQFANMAVALPQVRVGKVRALAVTSSTRFAALPNVPTMAEAGVKDFETDQWLGLLGPRGMPKVVAERLVAEVNRALATEELRNAFTPAGITPALPGTAASFSSYVQQDLARWRQVVKAQNIQAE